MPRLFGHHGRYLRVNLTTGQSAWIEIPEDVLRNFLGGVGLGTWLMHHEAPPRVDPLSAAAPLIFCLSPLVGTPLTTSAKFAVVAKSPLTNRLNDALSSSWFALAAKRAGMDALVVVGASESASLLIIENDTIRIESADHLWGLSAQQAQNQIREQLGSGLHCAAIGPAGENLVRYATLSHDNRHAGRGGMGAVMGAKKLKAIAVRGEQRVAIHDPQGVVEASRDLSRRSFGPATEKYRELGTVGNLLTLNRLGALPTRNFQQATFEQAEQFSETNLNEAHRIARRSCAACTIGCEHVYSSAEGETRLEYESLFALGSLCGIEDRETVIRAARRCDDLGLDTISAGATIAFAMECQERELLHHDGLHFGNGEILLSLLNDIGHRQGLGDLLAEGTRRTAERIGDEAPDFAPHVKGLEIPGYEPRTLQTMALGFAVSSRGADHNRSGAYEVDLTPGANRFEISSESVRGAIATEDRAALMDSLILCKFLRGVFDDFYAESAELLRRITGWSVTADELRTTAARIVTAKKLYNVREGWTRAEDTLPARFLRETLSGSETSASLSADRLQAMISEYYHARGWNEDGTVPAELLSRLNLTGI